MSSDLNLLNYLEENSNDKSPKSTYFRRSIIILLKEFLEIYKLSCIDFIETIKKKSTAIYLSDQSLIVKESMLSLIAKIIEIYDDSLIEKVYQPKIYLEFLLNEIKLKKLAGSIKGEIWHICGLLINKFSNLLNNYKLQISTLVYSELFEMLSLNETNNNIKNSNNILVKKFEFKHLIGILKSLNYLLDNSKFNDNQITTIYICLKGLIQPLEDANSNKVNKLALNILSNHGKMFYNQLQKDAIFLFDSIFVLCSSKNNVLKNAAHEAIEAIAKHISYCLNENKNIHKDSFSYIIIKIKSVLEEKTNGVMIHIAISLSK